MAILTAILNTLMVVLCLFLICLILIQRGKGGGLAGAFGGVGGSSAFGTKAGDIFTRVTIGVAAVWIVLSLILVALYNSGSDSAWGDDAGSTLSRELTPKSTDKSATGSPTVPSAPTTPAGASTTTTPPASPAASTPAAPAATSVPAIPPPVPPASTK